MSSFWTDTAHETIADAARWLPAAQAVVVGAGFTGLAAAYYLARQGATVMVLEQETVGFGASGRNGGQVLSGWPLDMTTIVARFGQDAAEMLWSVSEEALARVKAMVRNEAIHCDLTPTGHLEATASSREVGTLIKELAVLQSLSTRSFEFWEEARISERTGAVGYQAGIFDPAPMAFHPVNYGLGLARAGMRHGVRLYPHTRVTGIAATGLGKFDVSTSRGKVRAAQVLLCTNGYVPRFARWLRARILPVYSAQIAVTVAEQTQLPRQMPTVSASAPSYQYFRRVGARNFLFGGRLEREHVARGDLRGLLRQLEERIPALAGARLSHQWTGRIAISSDFMPHLARLKNGVWVAGGYTGHGAALSTEMGWLLARAVLSGEMDPRIRLLSSLPWRRFPLSAGHTVLSPERGLRLLNKSQRRLLRT